MSEDDDLVRTGIHDIRDEIPAGGSNTREVWDESEDETDRAQHISSDTASVEPSDQELPACRPSDTKPSYPGRRKEEIYRKRPEGRRSTPRSPSPAQLKKKVPPQGQQSYYIFCAAAVFCGLILLVQYLFNETSAPVPLADGRLLTLREHLRRLKDTYTAQPEYSWQIIRSSVVDMLNDTGFYTGPAVITFLASVKNERFATCLSKKVATALSYTFDDGGDYGTIDADELLVSEDVARHIIDNRCKEVVEKRQRHVMVASHLEQWNPDAAMMLHPLCDQENARYKNVTYILTVFTKHEDVSGRRERTEYDRLAETALNSAWESMDSNQRFAIISRVTGNVVLVREDSESCFA
uniref:Torsin-1A-interacting protein 1/2 AAA+ activator domain-containing protein n=1 Tax=Amblyomma cajennense TaxID=34607 RepID=A0A023FET5_AMBCJ